MSRERQELFNQAMDTAEHELPARFYERQSVGVAVGVGSTVLAEVATMVTNVDRPIEYLVGGVALLGGMLSDRLSTAKLFDQTNALEQQGIGRPTASKTPCWKKPSKPAGIFGKVSAPHCKTLFFAAAYALLPVSGIGVGLGTGLLSASNWRKTRRLSRAGDILDLSE